MGVMLRKLKVVTWKCLVMRRRHWLLTLFEIMIPTFAFGGLLYGLSKMPSTTEKVPATIPPNISVEQLLGKIGSSMLHFKYCPRTGGATTYMNKISAQLKAYNPGIELEFEGFDSELEMMKSFKNESREKKLFYGQLTNVGLVINTISKEKGELDYVLRTNNIMTSSMFADSSEPGPGNYYKTYFATFAPIQLLLDREFTSYVAGDSPRNSNNMNVSLQVSPYPEYIKAFGQIYSFGFPAVTAISFLFMFPLILTKVVQEKISGVKELQQMMGLPSWMIWYGFLFNSLLTALISMILVVVILVTGLHSFHLFKYSDPTVVFVILLLYVISCIMYCFLVASVFLKPTPSLIFGLVFWVVLLIILPASIDQTTSGTLKYMATFFPSYAMLCAFTLLGYFEINGVGLTWPNLFNKGVSPNGDALPVGILFLNMGISIVVLGLLTWYLDHVRPGPYGLKKSYLFFLKRSYWMFSKQRKPQTATDHTNYTATFEPPPPGARVGIRVRDLSKNFANFVAVDNISIDFYEGNITALLGHNGAGKTTTMSILTGMFPPSSGEVTVQNYNIFKHMDEFRDSLGLCPQHNLLFPYLSVIQHLIFFGMIKGLKHSESKSSGMDLLRMLNMVEKKNQPVANLSGGMKRKLQLAIALIGAPKILMLDEPTSGMDPESRREMWDLLLSMRGDRTIIITTHFMEEADVLGDRIAIMDHGKIKCYGTTLFLKKFYGAGYQLTFLTTDKIHPEAITSLIQSHVPDASLQKNTHSSQLLYTLPTQDTSRFPALFADLEQRKDTLGISSIGIACTTIEEVFLKVGELATKENGDHVDSSKRDNHRSTLEHATSNGESNREPLIHQKVKGIRLFMQRFLTLIKKRFIFFRNMWISNFLHILAFLGAIVFMVQMTDIKVDPSANPLLTFSSSLYKDAMYFMQDGTTGPDTLGGKVAAEYKKQVPGGDRFLAFGRSDNLSEKLLNIGRDKGPLYRNQLIGGASIHDANSIILFNSVPLHALPIAVNLFNNGLLKSVTGLASARITTANHPIDYDAVPICEGVPDRVALPSLASSGLWVTMLLLIMPIWFSMYFTFPVAERINNCKQLQLMTGLSWRTYWLALFTFDFSTVLSVLVLGFVLMVVYDMYCIHLLAYPTEIAVLFLVFFLFVVAMLLFTYSYSLIAGTDSLGYYFVINLVLAPLILGLSLISYSGVWQLLGLAVFVGRCTFPLPCFLLAVYQVIGLALYKSRCHLCPDNPVIKTMCREIIDLPYLQFPSDGDSILLPGCPIGLDLVYLVINIVVHVLFIAACELQVGGKIAKVIVDKFYSHEQHSFDQLDGAALSTDPDVQREKDRVDGLMQGMRNPEETNYPIFIVQNLKKTFFFVKRKLKLLPSPASFRSVRGVSFAVAPGECFGLLGVNGAGKTTTFRMLTGDTVCTHGTATLFNYSLRDRKNYLSGIGYCPQFNGINEQLSSQQMLECFAALRGIPAGKADPIITYWIELLGLSEYRYRRSGRYSGGNKRKLSTAVALIGDPPLVFLDEPTSGVDPISRHRLWAVLSQIQKTGQSIVLTSHSMDECEALCNRLTIMVRGEMQCLGNITYLKQRYGQGYTLMIKLKEGDVDELKETIRHEFKNKIEIKDEHRGLIHYQVLDTSLSWSTLFSKLESIKSTHNMVEDYSLSDTTLEQIFIAFAKGKTSRHATTTEL